MTTMGVSILLLWLQAAPPEEGKDACIRKPLYDSLALGLPPVEAQDFDLFNAFLATVRAAVSRGRPWRSLLRLFEGLSYY